MGNSITKGVFQFYRLLLPVEIHEKMRVSCWLKDKPSYSMPCEFIEVIQMGNNEYEIVITTAYNFFLHEFVGKEFFFGHPAKILGYGYLQRLQE